MAWPQDAYVGQKVVCVDDEISPKYSWSPGEKPKLLAEYTLSAIAINDNGKLVVQLLELKRTNHKIALNPWYAWYGAYRFRPVQTKSTETGMAILRKLQDPTNHKVLEGV